MGSNLFFSYPPLSQPLQLLQCIVDEVSLCPMYETVPNGVES